MVETCQLEVVANQFAVGGAQAEMHGIQAERR